MQRVPIAELQSGMITARNLYSADGQLLLNDNVVLQECHIKRLEQAGIPAVYVCNPHFLDLSSPEILDETIRVKMIQTLQKHYLAVREGRKWYSCYFSDMAGQIVAEVRKKADSLIHLTDIRALDECTFAHSVNVAMLSAMIGVALNYPQHKLYEVVLSGLLHDIGKMRINPALLNKAGKLTEKEFEIMKTHTIEGYKVLQSVLPQTIPVEVMWVAMQHHQRMNGTGYPQKLSSEPIHAYARIVSIADAYDALTCERPYREALFPHEACMIMTQSMGSQFDPVILTAFLGRLAIYPIGSIVLLSNDHIGIVQQVYPHMQNRPTVRLIQSRQSTPTILDLREHPSIEIKHVLRTAEVLAVTNYLPKKQHYAVVAH